MAATMLGIVYYADDPEHRIFRVVYPELNDSELDQPPTDHERKPMRDHHGALHSWHTFGTKLEHQPIFEKVRPHDERLIKSRGDIISAEARADATKA